MLVEGRLTAGVGVSLDMQDAETALTTALTNQVFANHLPTFTHCMCSFAIRRFSFATAFHSEISHLSDHSRVS